MVNYIYDGARVIEERDGGWDLLRRFVYGSGIDEPLSIYDDSSSEYYFYLRDGLGSVTELVDESGDVVEHYRYSSYGKREIYNSSWNELSASSVGNPYYFTGRRFDEESGLYYYRARMYSAEVGRFLQVDPIGYEDDLNLYRYCGNNPINNLDPLGAKWVKDVPFYLDQEANWADIIGTVFPPTAPVAWTVGTWLSVVSATWTTGLWIGGEATICDVGISWTTGVIAGFWIRKAKVGRNIALIGDAITLIYDVVINTRSLTDEEWEALGPIPPPELMW